LSSPSSDTIAEEEEKDAQMDHSRLFVGLAVMMEEEEGNEDVVDHMKGAPRRRGREPRLGGFSEERVPSIKR